MINKTDVSQQWKKIRKISIKHCREQHVMKITVILIWVIRKILNNTWNSYERIIFTQQLIISQKCMMRKVMKVRSLWSWNQRFSTVKNMTWIDWTAQKKLFIKQSRKKIDLAKLYEHSLSRQKMLSKKKKIILK